MDLEKCWKYAHQSGKMSVLIVCSQCFANPSVNGNKFSWLEIRLMPQSHWGQGWMSGFLDHLRSSFLICFPPDLTLGTIPRRERSRQPFTVWSDNMWTERLLNVLPVVEYKKFKIKSKFSARKQRTVNPKTLIQLNLDLSSLSSLYRVTMLITQIHSSCGLLVLHYNRVHYKSSGVAVHVLYPQSL